VALKKLFYAVAALVVLLVAAAALAPLVIDEAQIKARLAAEVKAATGRELAIDGHLEIALLPAPRLSLSGLRLANLEGASAPHVVRLKALEASLALAPLLTGEVAVRSLRLVEPVIELERLADGRVNWNLAGAASPRDRGAPLATLGGVTISVDRLTIVNGTLTYRDALNGRLERLEGLEARLSAGSLRGPFAAAGSARLRGVRLGFEFAMGRLQEGRSLALQAVLKLGRRDARVAFAGALSAPGAARELRGKLRAEGASLADLLSAVATAADSRVAVPALLAQPFRLATQVAANAAAANFNDLALTVGEARAAGAVSVAMTRAPKVDVTLAVNRLDLDAWLRSAAGATGGEKAGRQGDAAAAAARAIALPAGVGGSVELNLEAVNFRGGVIRQIQVEGTLGNRRFDLARASALLPGSSDILLSGTALTEGGQSRFEGRVEAASDNLRRLIGWLGIDVDRVPVDRLHKLSLTSSVRLTPELVQASGIDLRLDTSRLTGAVAYALRERPSFSLDVAVDRFNLDAYLPAEGERPEPAAKAPPLAVLESFDSNLKARIDKLVVNELQVAGLSLDASLVGGNLRVREASVAHLAGASAALSGSARDFAATPAVKANIDIRAGDAGRLLSALGTRAPQAVARLGAARLRGSLEGRVDDLTIDMELAAADATVLLKGGVSPSDAGRRFDLRLDLSHPDLARFGDIFGLTLPAAAAADRPLTVKGSVAGNLEAVEVDLAAEAGAAVVSVAGNLIALGVEGLEPSHVDGLGRPAPGGLGAGRAALFRPRR
jgi:uncharacterized protein involved in outer membrane biogenesis